ncbi:MAG: MerR family DNA-binding transcriptional regulator [Hoeflea sp.]|nr:MerR family DNA-binding transcriptional regulator [Hoeflea sp.]
MKHTHGKLLQIGEVAKRLGVSTPTIRRLDDELKPIRPNPKNGHRRYRLDLVERHLKRSS